MSAQHRAITQRYADRASRFETIVASAPAGTWSKPSPCEGWVAADVVQHVLDMHAAMLLPLKRPLSNAASVEGSPLLAFQSARRDLEDALTDDSVSHTQVPTPMGHMTLAEHIDQVASQDLVIHGWDLAMATGQDHELDPGEVARLWSSAQHMDERLRTPGAFGEGVIVYGPTVPVPDTAPTSHRLLGLLGRDPAWTAG